jgi:hypothetical protein
MNDTSPEIKGLLQEMMMLRSNEERFIMGALMFDAARELIMASLPANLPASELKQELFKHIYGYPLEFIPEASGTEHPKHKET